MKNIVFFNNQFIPYKKALLPLSTHALHYGTGCFEGIRAYWNKDHNQLYVFRAKEHYQRLAHSCRLLLIKLPYSISKLTQITIDLLRKNKFKEGIYIRPLVYKSEEKILNLNLTKLSDGLAIYALPFGRYLDVSKGIKVGFSSWRRLSDNALPPRAKIIGAYVNTSLAKTEAFLNGLDEAIFLTDDGHISEGSATNIFLVKNNRLVTPPVSADILEGITRQAVMTLAKNELEIDTLERQVDRTEVYAANEVFLCGTAGEVTPVVAVDHRKIGNGKPGQLTKKLQKVYFKVVHGENEKYQSWLTPVY